MKDFQRNPMKNSKKSKPIFYIIIGIAVIVSAALITVLYGGKIIPGWDEIYAYMGMEEEYNGENAMKVHFIDVGQGDCAFIHTDEYAVLVDAGERGYEETVTDYIKQCGFDTIDYVIATHPHSDHIGSLSGVIDEFTVLNVIMPKLSKSNTPTTSVYESFLKSVKKSGATVISATPGKNITVGQMEMMILGPAKQFEDLNDMSVVFNLIYGDTSFLFTGDAEKPAENEILNGEYKHYLDADVLKAGHHGSSTSTGKAFLDIVSPELAIVSCGIDNDYGHPHRETVSLFAERGIEMLRTDESGTIVITSNGEEIFY